MQKVGHLRGRRRPRLDDEVGVVRQTLIDIDGRQLDPCVQCCWHTGSALGTLTGVGCHTGRGRLALWGPATPVQKSPRVREKEYEDD